jgi:hypothetical protein
MSSGGRLHMEVCKDTKCFSVLSRDTYMVCRWSGRASATNTKLMGTIVVGTSVAFENYIFGRRSEI